MQQDTSCALHKSAARYIAAPREASRQFIDRFLLPVKIRSLAKGLPWNAETSGIRAPFCLRETLARY
ncbi:UNVERIFIED_ORG: hypothetical protein J2W85_005981 [Ensifer adhaerens]|nr:hypothetical protein [Ensifer adhaerens]